MSRREEENKLNSENIGREKSWVARCFFPERDFWTANNFLERNSMRLWQSDGVT
jgi:hypothetical protein